MNRNVLTVALTIIFLFALTAPAFASIEHEATYKWDGTISFSQQAGHYCNTGAEMQQTITGQGSMTKSKEVYMEEGMITVSDTNDWITAPNAVRNLTVTSAIKLCAPAKHVFTEEGEEALADFYDDVESLIGPEFASYLASFKAGDPVPPELGYLFDWESSMNNILRSLGFDEEDLFKTDFQVAKPISEQIWAVQVAADPGYSGNIHMSFEAANSNKMVANGDVDGAYNGFWLKDSIYEEWPGYSEQKQGPWFPGSYFNIEQFSRTSQGTHRRYIDISSPWSHGYLNEEMRVVGMSEVWEAFSMDNLPAGDEVGSLWWKLF